ncbi:hypothetical protein LBMAG53_14980 [Planctomycetota bacterium]|nr:hypothetical protein LBMAG53_14980 [Planctomycetota bacterium]
MMPVLAAHDRQRSDWQHDLREHYRRFMSDRAALDSGLLNRLQYLNTFAVFLSLSTGTNSDNEIRDQVEYLTAEWHRAWFLPAWQWGRTPFPGGMPERIAWKLTTPNPSLTYYRAIIDEEEFGLAIASSLIVARRKLGMADDPDMIAALAWAGTIYRDEMVAHPDGGIIFQPGVYRDHRDYQYAGHQVLAPSLPPSPVDGIGPDTSHSHRTLVFLRQHTMAAQLLGQDATVFIRTARGFAQRFRCLLNERTLNGRRFWSTVNYTSGHDGLYRYRYVTTSESGYGPGELSGTMTLGWWGGNADGGLADFYGDMLTTFPLSEAAIRLYVGPNTTRVRHPMMTWPTFFNNGFAELLVRLASGQRAGRRLVSTNG